MYSFQKNGRGCQGVMILVSCVLVLSLALTGCEPLRKKFTRKKREKDPSNELIPVLEPIDYPEPTYTPQDRYKQHYSLWRVWYRDLWDALAAAQSSKRQNHALSQTISELKKMQELIKGEKQKGLAGVIQGFQDIQEELQSSSLGMRNISLIRSSVSGLEKKVRNNYQYEQVKDSF